MENSKSTFVSILRRICAEEKIELNAYAYDWVFCLKKGARSRYLYGYKFPINDAASASLCDDKGALSEVLEQNGVAHIPHMFFLSPADRHYVGGQGDEKDMLALLRQYGSDAVIKPNFGTGGYDVCRVRSEEELRRESAEIFKSSSALAMSPYVEILQEYRAVMLDGTLELLFEKKRPQVEGNGTDTVAQLAAAQLGDGSVRLPPKVAEQIPARGQTVLLGWKHNLGQGAQGRYISDNRLVHTLQPLAASAMRAAEMRFASVDIVHTAQGYFVLEINSGVMLEHFASQSAAYRDLATEVYRRVILRLLA